MFVAYELEKFLLNFAYELERFLLIFAYELEKNTIFAVVING